jgi:hypothetical protein
MEEDEQRKDTEEGIERIEQINWMKMLFGEKEVEFSKNAVKNKLLGAQLKVSNPDLEGNLFSMIAITTGLSNITDTLDKRNMQFGDSFLVVFNPKEFLSRIEDAIKITNFDYKWGLVKYYDDQIHDGELGIFYKSNRFDHQNEFRIFVHRNFKSPLILNIGNMDDISEIFKIEEFEKCRFKLQDIQS